MPQPDTSVCALMDMISRQVHGSTTVDRYETAPKKIETHGLIMSCENPQAVRRCFYYGSDFFAQEGMTRTAVGLEQQNVIAVETRKAVLRAYPYLSVIVLEKTPDTVVGKSVTCGHLP